MKIAAAIVFCLFIAATAVALLQTFSMEVAAWKKALFAAIRILFAVLIIIAFTEPSFTIGKLPPKTRPLPVLIDVSKSMSLFPLDSAIKVLRDKMETNDRPKSFGVRKLQWFAFGDSLRKLEDPSSIKPNDKRSFFPDLNYNPLFRNTTEFILISDAQWSNPGSIAPEIGDKTVWYMPLVKSRFPSVIQASIPDTIKVSAGKPFVVKIPCSGRTSGTATLTIVVIENADTVSTDSVVLGGGMFAHTFDIKVSGAKSGLHLYKVEIVNPADSVCYNGFLLVHAVPQKFSYKTIPLRQSPDIRFLRIALERTAIFTEAAPKEKKIDAVFYFGDGGIYRKEHPEGTLPVYIGCLPGNTQRVVLKRSDRYFIPECGKTNNFYGFSFRNLPPLGWMVLNRDIIPNCPWISAVTGKDTIPLVFEGFHRNERIVVCACGGFWKWDFIPLSRYYGEAESFVFSGRLIEAVAGRLHMIHTDTLIVFPYGQATANDSLRLLLCIPEPFEMSKPIQLKCTIEKTAGLFRKDTVLVFPEGGTFLARSALPPLDSGRYLMQCSLYVAKRPLYSSVEFEVSEDKTELLVPGQNENLLREIGQPLDLTSKEQINSLLKPSDDNIIGQAVRSVVVIKRSWWLLITILAFLGVEWFIRKFSELD